MIRVNRAMVMAAGFGKRMRPMTDTRPKPLVEVCGRALIDHVLDRLEAAGIESVVVNAHYLGDQIEAHLDRRRVPHCQVSREEVLLETGGSGSTARSRRSRDWRAPGMAKRWIRCCCFSARSAR
jgi:MurNAc alpha-1-phosphate uridylyltransferase